MEAHTNISANARRWRGYLLTWFTSVKMEYYSITTFKSNIRSKQWRTVHMGVWNLFCPIPAPSEWKGASIDTHWALLLARTIFFHKPSYRTLLISPLWKRSPQEVQLRSMCMSCSSPCGRTWGRREKKEEEEENEACWPRETQER